MLSKITEDQDEANQETQIIAAPMLPSYFRILLFVRGLVVYARRRWRLKAFRSHWKSKRHSSVGRGRGLFPTRRGGAVELIQSHEI